MLRRVLFIIVGMIAIAAGAYAVFGRDQAPSTSAEPARASAAAPAVATPPPPKPSETPRGVPDKIVRAPVSEKKADAPSAPPAPEAPPTTATLHIDSDVPGAQVFIDHTFVGATPVTAKNVTPGPHRLNVSVPGGETYADFIDVVPGPRDIKVRLTEIKLDAKIDVTHKHAFGSCKGTLIASVQGLRYDTPNKNDAFSAGFAEIAAFDVDELEKILKVKLKSGKQYNFTDAEGNAARLSAFHAEVSAAREKLKKGGGTAEGLIR